MADILSQEEIKALLEVIEDNKDTEIKLPSTSAVILGEQYEHYKTKDLYVPIDLAFIQIDDKWVDAVIYIEVGSGVKYVRTVEEFVEKFQLAY